MCEALVDLEHGAKTIVVEGTRGKVMSEARPKAYGSHVSDYICVNAV